VKAERQHRRAAAVPSGRTVRDTTRRTDRRAFPARKSVAARAKPHHLHALIRAVAIEGQEKKQGPVEPSLVKVRPGQPRWEVATNNDGQFEQLRTGAQDHWLGDAFTVELVDAEEPSLLGGWRRRAGLIRVTALISPSSVSWRRFADALPCTRPLEFRGNGRAPLRCTGLGLVK